MTLEELIKETKRIRELETLENRYKEHMIKELINNYGFHNQLYFDEVLKEMQKYIRNETIRTNKS